MKEKYEKLVVNEKKKKKDINFLNIYLIFHFGNINCHCLKRE